MSEMQQLFTRLKKAGHSTQSIWAIMAQSRLNGVKIKNVRWLTDEEMFQLGWDARSVVIELDNGHALFASQDDEGNGPGALFTTYDDLDTLPVIYS